MLVGIAISTILELTYLICGVMGSEIGRILAIFGHGLRSPNGPVAKEPFVWSRKTSVRGRKTEEKTAGELAQIRLGNCVQTISSYLPV